ncbi:MAG: LysR family transcriptional regulator [Pseudomonas sp.]|nr:LysR family transcriptional regulator [Pseudomonas sp.]
MDQLEETARNLGLLFLRLSGAAFLFYVHGLPKWLNYSVELQRIEDPFHLGAQLTLGLAIFAEVLCPLAIALGLLTRLACLPILTVLIIALAVVHPDWTLEQGQFGWLLLIIFVTVLVAGPGRYAVGSGLPGPWRHA